MRTAINRDPFARSTLYRTRYYVQHATCSWCGQVKTTKSGARYLFGYDTVQDGGRDAWAGLPTRIANGGTHLFCSVGCMREYTGA